jgi:Proline utilization A N-terminal domain
MTPLETAVHDWGERIFLSDENGRLTGFVHQERTSGALMDWSMLDESFKTQLFRFVDVLGETVVSETDAMVSWSKIVNFRWTCFEWNLMLLRQHYVAVS